MEFQSYLKYVDEHVKTVDIDTAIEVIRNTLVLMGAADFRERVDHVVRSLAQYAGAERCRIILIDEENQKAITFSQQSAAGTERSAAIPYEIAKTWDKVTGNGEGIIIRNEQEMDQLAEILPAWTEHMHCYGVNSLILCPLRREDDNVGYIYLRNYDTARDVQIRTMLDLMSFIMGSEISNFMLRQKLDGLSRLDELTGLQNRNAMQRRIQALTEEYCLPLGVINMDLNGLKKVNDEQGHDAGDRMLIHAARRMREVFSEEVLYRAGGDEFVAVMSNISRETFNGMLRQLHGICDEDPSFSIAIGSYWTEHDLENVKTAFLSADECMYMDKRTFYEQHPEKDRRNRKDLGNIRISMDLRGKTR